MEKSSKENKEATCFDGGMSLICPKCGETMEELPQDLGEMTEGQESDYESGFNRPFSCPKCSYYCLSDISPEDDFWEDPEIDELVKITKIDPQSFEDVIENALKNKCFIEATSLIHNVIEVYLKRKLEDFFVKDLERFNLLKKKIKLKFLYDYNLYCYILGIIKKEDYKEIIEFNKERNKAIHDLLKKDITLEELRLIAYRGRKMQLKLSPLKHTPQEINMIMDIFDQITKE